MKVNNEYKLLEKLPSAIIVCNLNGKILFQNYRAKAYFGSQPDLNALCSNFSIPKQADSLSKMFLSQIEDPEERVFDRVGMQISQHRHFFRIQFLPYLESDRRRLQIVLQNQTKEIKYRKAKALIDKMHVHELKQPLQLIKAYCFQLNQYISPKKTKFSKYVDKIDTQADILAKISDQNLLTKNANHKRVVLNTILDKVAQSNILAHPDHKIVLNICAQQLVIMGNEALITQAIQNVLDNALKYSDINQPINILLDKTKDCYQISVSNTGKHIQKRELKQIFEPYFRTRAARNQNGSGLGLALVKSTMKEHGGQILVEEEGKNALKFSLIFPITR